MFTRHLKDIIKDTDEQSGEEIHRERSRRVPSTGASVPVKLGHVILPVWGCVHSPGTFSEPHTIGIFMEALHCRHDDL